MYHLGLKLDDQYVSLMPNMCVHWRMIVRIYLDAKSALDQYRRHTYLNPISLGFQELCFLSDLLDERNPIDLVEGRLAREYFFYSRFA